MWTKKRHCRPGCLGWLLWEFQGSGIVSYTHLGISESYTTSGHPLQYNQNLDSLFFWRSFYGWGSQLDVTITIKATNPWWEKMFFCVQASNELNGSWNFTSTKSPGFNLGSCHSPTAYKVSPYDRYKWGYISPYKWPSKALNPEAILGGKKPIPETFQEVPSLNPKGWWGKPPCNETIWYPNWKVQEYGLYMLYMLYIVIPSKNEGVGLEVGLWTRQI